MNAGRRQNTTPSAGPDSRMCHVKRFFHELFHTFFRYYNFPCALGLIRIGNPGEESPVFLSGNYTLTVQRLLRKLRGIDCYLLVANSRGCNVWCAAGMNEFSDCDVVDAITVSRLAEIVRHRRIVAPPCAAPGVDVEAVKRVTGFHLHWGPMSLNDLPEFIRNDLKRTPEMAQIRFPLRDRLEQAAATALAYAMTIGVGLIFWPVVVGKLIGLIAVLYAFAFGLFPWFPEERHWRRFMLQAGILLGAQAVFGYWRGWHAGDFGVWCGLLLGILVLVAIDQCGSTPIYKTGATHWLTKGDYRSLFSPVVDPALCINCMQCVLACPQRVFAGRRGAERGVVSVRPERCEECFACIKQCHSRAIFNRSGRYKGDVKSVPGLQAIVTRSWAHLRREDRWIGAPTVIRGSVPCVVEPRVSEAVACPMHTAGSL
jgi:Pyruvate/2-oxoacid:ferredoxin oxidoreductase delta subunit